MPTSSPTDASPVLNKSQAVSKHSIHGNSVSCSEDFISSHSHHVDPDGLHDSLEFTGLSPGGCEDVLNWHVFEGRYDSTVISSRIFSPDDSNVSEQHRLSQSGLHPSNGHQLRCYGPGRGIMEDHIPHLIEKFLVNVHIKNPVLDPDDLKVKAKWTAEHGFGWDSTSCLIVSRTPLTTLTVGEMLI